MLHKTSYMRGFHIQATDGGIGHVDGRVWCCGAREKRRSCSARRSSRQLAAVDPRKSQIVELRFFRGLSVDETAEVLNVAPSTVYKDFDLAKLWLLRQLERANSA
jgi:DNA-directed RNA polymerase specialized sigma24 family protein